MTERHDNAVINLKELVDSVYNQMKIGEIPVMELSTRSKKNIEFDPKKSVWTYGNMKTQRTAKTVTGATMMLRTAC
ncbi:MAG: DNA topoisomerase VI, partial [Candidatus Methanomethylophilaceae archaeon]|nr:DNA topoisomerase VI [Candidatus Methanomethylophilaceae archaeon]